ncbi:hypothetical protein Taro_022633 [Colocasia esculenta]|uniref:Uncharacterized protein n=1 Tax=Colocasia esculenta TaxID=4460 RepID=A0A843V5W7_COLES|nr:hypothetical protein [Colocasia esculenta]
MEVLRLVPKQSLEILLTKGTVPLKDNTTPTTPAGLLLFPGIFWSLDSTSSTSLSSDPAFFELEEEEVEGAATTLRALGTVPLKDNKTPSTPAGLLLFPDKKAAHFSYRSRNQPPGTNPSAVLLDLNPQLGSTLSTVPQLDRKRQQLHWPTLHIGSNSLHTVLQLDRNLS